MKLLVPLLLGILLIFFVACKDGASKKPEAEVEELSNFQEPYRPQFHFTPKEMWMNDPNGLVYNEGVYHLFYQYYPEDIVWGPMHWGHAVSKDMVYWEHRPIALYPDQNGMIFSGSAVVDTENSSGFGTIDNPPLVAVFTYHSMDGEKEGRTDYQTQGIAYSLDNGESWTKYMDNPVLANEEGFKDYRDPKVFWHDGSGQWIMVLVAGDHARFYRSADLKSWDYLSSFGKEQGAHGGVWECPDLFPLQVNEEGEEKWVLIISINPGAPNGGSGTQYFVGNFDGTSFTSQQQDTRWIDWGTDNYAGVTYNNVPSGERIFIGWMSNWDYARTTPTEAWRSAMTLPRKLSLHKKGEKFVLANEPLTGLGTILKSEISRDLSLDAEASEGIAFDHFNQAQLRFNTAGRDFRLSFINDAADTLKLMMDGRAKDFKLDRTVSGRTGFDPKFAPGVQHMPMDELAGGDVEFRILLDWSSVEVFVDGGLHAMTAQVFPNEPYKQLLIENTGSGPLILEELEISRAESIWDYTPE